MAKEVKKPRKPATKKATKEKKVKEVTVQIEGAPAPIEGYPAPDELVELKAENITISEGALDGKAYPDEPTEEKEEKIDNRDFNQFNEYKVGENEFDMTKADSDEVLEMYKLLNNNDLVVLKSDKKPEEENQLKPQEEENQLKPQEVIEEFSEATKKLDSIIISENPEEVLKKELEKANEVAEQLKKQIKEQESNYYNPGKTWNGVSDGWYDY